MRLLLNYGSAAGGGGGEGLGRSSVARWQRARINQ